MRHCLSKLFSRAFTATSIQNLKLGQSIRPALSSQETRINNKFAFEYMGVNSFCFSTSKLTKQEIKESTYQELVDKITKLYNFKQYKIPSALSLLQIHHQFKLFKPGDWVLDIGAGPNWAWTDLALKMTHTPNGSNKVISNDLTECKEEKQNNICVAGNFLQEQIRTKIAMHLLERQLNTILIDATPQYSGNQDFDAQRTVQVLVSALEFSQHYLKKGGTIIFKTVQSPYSLQVENQAKFFFHEVYRYKSSNFRPKSPAFFFVLKGFMMTDNLSGLQNLLKEYSKAKSSGQKINVVEKYRKKYQWDPVAMIGNQAKQIMAKMKMDGKKNRQIEKLFENDPYVKAGHILSLMDKVEDKKSNAIQKIKAKRELLLGEKEGKLNIPQTKEEFVEAIFTRAEEIEKEEKQLAQQKASKKKEGGKQKQRNISKVKGSAPLQEDEIYMKSAKINQKNSNFDDEEADEYQPEDLYGFNPDNPQQSINRKRTKNPKEQQLADEEELQKLMKSFPQIKEALTKNGRTIYQGIQNMEESLIQKLKTNEDKEDPFRKKQPFSPKIEEEEDDGMDEDGKLKPSSYLRNEKKFKGLDKKMISESEFDFDEQTEQLFEKLEKEQRRSLHDDELDQQNRVQYLKTKPKKANWRGKQKSKKPGSYFKLKNKDKSDLNN